MARETITIRTGYLVAAVAVGALLIGAAAGALITLAVTGDDSPATAQAAGAPAASSPAMPGALPDAAPAPTAQAPADGALGEASTLERIRANVAGIPARGLTLGRADAPVTIMEFADVACPHCRAAATDTLPAVIDGPVRSGDAKLQYVPVAFLSESSARGALGVLAAANQDAAWPFVEAIFHGQGDERTDWLDQAGMERIARGLGLDVARWRADYASPATRAQAERAMQEMRTANITGTPTFLISGPAGTARVEGRQPAQVLADAVTRAAGR